MIPKVNAGATRAEQGEVVAAFGKLVAHGPAGVQVQAQPQPDGTVLVLVTNAAGVQVGGAHSRNGEGHAYALAVRAATVLCKVHDAGGEGWVGQRPTQVFTRARNTRQKRGA